MSVRGVLNAAATKQNITRSVLVVAGATAMVWALAVVPAFWSENVVTTVAGELMAGEVFTPNALTAVEALTERTGSFKLRSSMLGRATVVRLRQAEDAMRGGTPSLVRERLASLEQIVDETFRNAPQDSLLWLIEFWLKTSRDGLRPDNLRFLKMSYELGPYEGWIAIKRNGAAFAAYSILPRDLIELATSEFVGLVRWGMVSEAAAIAAGPGLPLRGILFPRLKDLSLEQRRAFAAVIYGRELDDVPVPGIAPPSPAIREPVMPPDL
jgi:hypothetical protein